MGGSSHGHCPESISPEIFQEQLIVRFALDGEARQQLIIYPPSTLEEAIKRVKTYQLSRRAVVRR